MGSFRSANEGNNANISGISMGDGNTVSFMQNSPGASQEVAVPPFLRRRVESWLDDLERRGSAQFSSPEDKVDIAELAVGLRKEVQGEAQTGRVRELVGHIVGLLGTTTASLASAGLTEAGQALLQQLGQ